jgi:thiol-disulfide isomerase/thioredoxin
MFGKSKFRPLLFVAALACIASQAVQAAPNGKLTIGDPAPMIQVKEFVKGGSVTGCEKGKLYVVEFWATWCGPCKMSIPHLTELQKKFPQVKFVGVSVWENNQAAVKPFVKEMGDKMNYCVAMDTVPPGKTGNDGLMAKTWMTAAGQDGIPSAFIINKDSKIAWIGHPMTMEEPLKKIIAGDWDLKAEKAKIEKEQDQKIKMMALRQKLQKAAQSGDQKQILAVIDQAISEDPSMEAQLGSAKFNMLQKDPEQAAAYGTHLVDKVLNDNAMGLNALSWSLVDPARPSKADPKLVAVALKAIQRADELSKGKDPAIADTLGCAYFASGNVAKALETQERAVKLAKGTEFEKDPDIAKRLEQYRKAAGK